MSYSVDIACEKPLMTANEQRRANWMQVRTRKRHQHAWVLYTVPNVRFDRRLWATLPILDLSIFESLEACE